MSPVFNVAEARFLHPKKALVPMLVIVPGMVTDVIVVLPENAFALILTILNGNDTNVVVCGIMTADGIPETFPTTYALAPSVVWYST